MPRHYRRRYRQAPRHTVWQRGPGQNSVYWSGPPAVETATRTVSFRPPFSPEGIVAHGMYAGYGACAPCDAEYQAKSNQRLLLYAGLLAAGFLLARSVSPKKNPRKKMKVGERIVRVGSGLALGGIGALGWMGPQAIEPVSTLVGVPTSIAGVYLLISGLTSPETASQIRKEATGG